MTIGLVLCVILTHCLLMTAKKTNTTKVILSIITGLFKTRTISSGKWFISSSTLVSRYTQILDSEEVVKGRV
jgi:hypothetical protein